MSQAQITALESLSTLVPVGVILPYGGENAPNGWFLCNGAYKYTDDYPALSDIIGTAFGSRTYNNRSQFRLPDLRNKTLMGGGTRGASSSGAIPNITGYAGYIWSDAGSGASSGALYGESYGGGDQFHSGGGTASHHICIDASRVSSLYKTTSYIEPANVRVNFIIKY